MYDDIPDLEDFSQELKEIKKSKNINEAPVKLGVKVINDSNSKNNNATSTIDTQQEFGSGFKKGFLKKQSNSNTTSTINSTKKEDIVDLTHIKSKKINEINEVQEKMNNVSIQNDSKFLIKDIVNNKKDWLNQDLLMKLAKNPKLLQAFMHPSFTDVISLLQSNPEEAKKKYGSNPEFNEFFKEFSSLMADHFKNLGDKQTESFINQNAKNDAEVEEILKDPKVIKLLEKMKVEGKIESQDLINDQSLMIKIDILIKKGVLKTINQ